jgi:hypothetical protein
MKDWEIIAEKLSKAGWSLGCVSAVDYRGRTIWIADFEMPLSYDTEFSCLWLLTCYDPNQHQERFGDESGNLAVES